MPVALLDPMIRIAGLTRRYGTFTALDAIDLDIARGEFVTLLGPSGSGKSTLLNLISGMTRPSGGRLELEGREATDLPTNQRGLGMVFQNYALMPHMTVFENIAFPLQVRKIAKAEIRDRVHEVLRLIQLDHVADRRPKQLSGGQQQRISLARCIVYRPSIILMDEPLGALDKKLREDMQLEIKRLHSELGITMVYVTHDQEEALTMSDRIVLMRNGRIEQQGTPDDLYFRPDTVFTADFLGISNLIPGTVSEGGARFITALGDTPLPAARPGAPIAGEGVLMIRPESLRRLDASETVETPVFEGLLTETVVLGSLHRHYLRAAGDIRIIIQETTSPGQPRPTPGERIRFTWPAAAGRLLPAKPAD